MSESLPNSADDFIDRFWELQQEASKYGIASLVIIDDSDFITQTSRMRMNRIGSTYLALGLLDAARKRLHQEIDESAED